MYIEASKKISTAGTRVINDTIIPDIYDINRTMSTANYIHIYICIGLLLDNYIYRYSILFLLMENDIKRKQYLQEILLYYKEQYLKMLNVPNIEYLTNGQYQIYSHRTRIVGMLQLMKYCYLFSKSNTITIALKATINTSTIYAYVYGSSTDNIPLDIKYVCLGGTYQSQDGEYRNGLIMWRQYLILAEHYADIIKVIEDHIVSKLTSGQLQIQADIYYPHNTHNQSSIEEYINTSRLAINMLVFCWLRDHSKKSQNHLLPNYTDMISSLVDSPITIDNIGGISDHISYFCVSPDEKHLHLQVGQKVMPLTYIEALSTNDINCDIWKEIYVNNIASNLVINLISPSFSVINNWFYIQSAHAGLFDNLSMHDKYQYSEVSDTISTSLKEANKYNYVDNQYINDKFLKVSHHIAKTLHYIDSDIRLTDLAICVTSEHVGLTLRDAINDDTITIKYLFEYMYALLCMHSKLGVMHCDLHMNNMTIHKFYDHEAHKEYLKMPPKIVYVIGEHVYVFDHNGCYASIIDFSRSLMGNKTQITHRFGKKFAESYILKQRAKLLEIIPKHIQDAYTNNVTSIVSSDFELAFKIFSVLDAMSVLEAFKNVKNQELAALASSMLTQCNNQLRDNLMNPSNDLEWPLMSLITDNFSEYLLSNNDTSGSIAMELFNYNNNMEYDISEYSTWGPLLQIDKEIELRKKYDQEMYDDIKNWVDYKAYDESEDIKTLIEPIKKEEQYLLEVQDWLFI